MKRVLLALLVAGLALALAAVVWLLNLQGEDKIRDLPAPPAPTAQQVERGAYLARVGNCMTCHTARGAAAYAGGRAVDTPFGPVYSSNLTSDADTGIGRWTADHFWRALHHGRSRDGRLLYPAFPYPNYTLASRTDSDAIFAFLRSQPAVRQPNQPHGLRWPFSTQAALAVWRALYFRPATFTPDPRQTGQWNRGSYLVEGLGHCSACHTPRNALGASAAMTGLSGGLIPMQNWYAPALNTPLEGGVAEWQTEHVVQLLQTGIAPGASVLGPMAEVVLNSTQHWSVDDLRAMAVFLQALPQAPAPAARRMQSSQQPISALDGERHLRGARIYEQQCAQCHGDGGRGVPGAYPALAGNRAVLMPQSANLVQIVLHGGFAPSTAGNPRPFGMPPYLLQLSDAEVASVLTHIRGSWGNQAPAVTELEVNRQRSGVGQ